MSWLIVFLTASATPGGYGLGVDPWRPITTDNGPLSVFRDSVEFIPPEDGRLRDRDGCPILLRVDDCADDSFWQTTCGAKALIRDDLPGACADAFEAYSIGRQGSLTREEVVDPLTGEVIETWNSDADAQNFDWVGLDATYAPYLLQLTHPRNQAESFLAGLELLWWQDNCSVQSCGELAFEAFRDYSVFEVAAAQDLRDGDYRAIYERAYGSGGIARRTLRSLAGERLPPLDLNSGRDRYLPGFRGYARGPLYGFQPGNTPRIAWNTSNLTEGANTPQVMVPYLLHALGDLDASYVNADDIVDPNIVVDFRDECSWDTATGLLVCGTDAAATSVAMADLFNARLFNWDTGTIGQIPPATAWLEDGADPWDVHQSASDTLSAAGFSDDKLVWLEDRQAALGDLRRERERLYSRLTALAAVVAVPPIDRCSGTFEFPIYCDGDPETEVPERMAELVSVEARIAALIDLLEANQCFGPAPTACDWSPRWFSSTVTGHYRDEREALFAECTLRTGDDFRSLRNEPGSTDQYWLVAEDADLAVSSVGAICDVTDTRSPDPRCEVRSDYLRDDATVKSYFATLDAWGDAFTERWNFPVNPDTGQPVLGGTVSDMASLGGSQFGIDMAYSAGWAVPSLDPLPGTLSATAHGQLQIGAKVFGTYVPVRWSGDENEIGGNPIADGFASRRERASLAFIDLYASNRGTGTDAWMVFDLLGTELYRDVGGTRDPNASNPLSYHYVAEPEPAELVQNVGSVRSTVFVGPVPLNLVAGAAGTVGIESKTELRATGGTQSAGAHVEAFNIFRPFARASVFAQASVGIDSLLSGGLRADLDLIELGLPVTTTVDATFDPLRDDTDLVVDVSADLELILLRGALSAFVEVPWDRYSQTLFRFDGVTKTSPLASTQFGADLTAIQRAFGVRNDGEAATLRRGETADARLIENRPGECEEEVRIEPDFYVDFDDENISGGILSPVLGTGSFDVTGMSDGLIGVHGQTVQTDGTVLTASSTSAGSGVDDYTVAFWFQPQDDTPGTVFAHGSAAGTLQGIQVTTAINDQVRITVPCAAGRRVVSTRLRTEVDYNHIAISHNAATRQVITLVDGRPLPTIGNCQFTGLDSDLHFGGAVEASGPTGNKNIRVDELGIWLGTALDVHQVQEVIAQGVAGLPLAGPGSAPLATVRNVDGDLTSDGAGLRLELSWTNPPSLNDPEGGYDRVIVRYGTDGYPTRPNEGELAYEGTGTGVVTSVPVATPRVYVSTWAAGPAGVGIGDRIEVSPDAVDLPTVSNVMTVPGDRSVRLSWTLPTDPAVASVLVAKSDVPLTRPEDGVVIHARRTSEDIATGLPNGLPVVFTIWTQDGFGRLSEPVSVSATPFAGAQPDVLAPGSLADVDAYATEDGVFLRWEYPFDLDPLSTVVRRVDRGVFRRTLGTAQGNRFEDREVLPGRTYRYELAAIDPAGNVGPGATVDVTVESVDALASLNAEVNGANVDLSWPVSPEGTGVIIVRSTLSTPQIAWEGDVVCQRAGLRTTCTDSNVPADTTLYYSAFVVDGDAYSPAVSTTAIRSVPTGQAGEDRDVFVGERVDLVADSVTDAAWTADVPLIRDASGTWFLATEPGPITVNMTGTQGSDAVDDDAVITVLSYSGTDSQTDDNPLATGRLAGAGVRSLFARDNDLVADLGGGEVLLIDGLTETPRTLTDCSTLRHVEGNLAICGDSFQTVRGFDLSTGDEVWTAPGPQGTWVSDLNDGVFALLTTSLAEDSEVRLALVDETASFELGTLVLATNTGIPLHIALDDTADTLAVASFNAINGFAASGVAGTVDAFPVFTESVTVGNAISDVAWADGNLAATVETNPGEPGRLLEYAFGTGLAQIRDIEAPIDVLGIRPYSGGLLLIGSRDAMTVSTDGTVRGPFTATSYALQDAAFSGSQVWAAAIPGEGIGGDQVTVHPASFPRQSGDAPVLFDPLDIGFSFVDALVTAQGTWAAKALDQLAVGTADGLTFSASIGFSTAPFDLTNMVCTDEQQVTYVGDVAGVPSVVRAPIDANALLPSTSWPIPDSCTAGVCGDYGAVMVCGGDLVQYDLDTGDELRRAPVPSEMGFPQVASSPTGAQLTDFGAGGEIYSAVTASAGTLAVTEPQEIPGYFGGGVLTGPVLHIPGTGLTERLDLSGAQTTLAPIPPANAEILEWDTGLMSLTATRRDAILRGGSSGIVAGSTGDKSFGLSADQGLVLANTGSQVIAHRTAPLGVVDDIATAQTGDGLTTEVRLDDSLDLTGVRVECAATTGFCFVDDVDPTRRIATITWDAGTTPGDHELLVWVGTHRWFTTATDRISVELP